MNESQQISELLGQIYKRERVFNSPAVTMEYLVKTHWNLDQQAALTRFVQSHGLAAAIHAAFFAEEICSYWRNLADSTKRDNGELLREIAFLNEQISEHLNRIARLEGLLLNQTALYEAERDGLLAQLDQCQYQAKGEI